MPQRYSKSLIEKTIENFQKEDCLTISVETAIEYLDDLSGLFLAFADKKTPDHTLCVSGVFCVKNEVFKT